MTKVHHFEDIELSPYKWVTHIDKLESLAQGRDVYPVTVELDVVDFCNHHCGWCVDPLHKNDRLDESFVMTFLYEAKKIGIEGIVFKGGGEPTLHPAFPQILEETRLRGFDIGVVSNGSKLVDVHDAIIRNANYLRVSIDGPTPATHAQVHGSKDFNRVVEGVNLAVRLRDSLKQRHPLIGLSFAMDHSMIDKVEDAVALGDTTGVNYILLRPPFFEEVGRPNTMTFDEKKELLAMFEKCAMTYTGSMKIYIDYWISDNEAEAFSPRGDSPRRGKYIAKGANGIEHVIGTCRASPLLAVITAERKVYPCCNLRLLEDWNIGTINYEKGDTFEKIWYSDRRKEVMGKIHCLGCIKACTHPMSKYNEIIEYLRSPQYHRGFV